MNRVIIKLVSFLMLLVFLVIGSYFYYRQLHPKYVPLPPRPEVTITIIPGWDLRDIAVYLQKQGFVSTTQEFYAVVGEPAVDYRKQKLEIPSLDFSDESYNSILANKLKYVSYEGYLTPDTYRVYKNSTLEEIVKKLIAWRLNNITPEMYSAMEKTNKTFYDVLTMASILEKEVQKLEDKKIVADIFWRRLKMNWALQADSTVHYAVAKEGNVFTTSKDRQVDSLWNTYKYPGLPLSPICNPGLESIKAALYPEKNNYWYFLTDKNGKVHYAKTLEEQSANRYKYLR